MTRATQSLLERLDLEAIDRDLFRGVSPQDGQPRVFGGQVAAQALVAAVRTVDASYPAHSLHAYFLRPGDPKIPILYEVDRIRDGRSFLTRRVVAIQQGVAIFNMSASFHRKEAGLDHHLPMPDVPGPESVPSLDTFFDDDLGDPDNQTFRVLRQLRLPVLVHDLSPNDPRRPEKRPGVHYVWFKSRGPLPQDALFHQCVLTFASDLMLADSALRVHGRTWFEPSLMVASLDHVLWFHRPLRADEWVLYAMESPSSSGSRGLNTGSFFQDGSLVATVVQESLMRELGKPEAER